LAVQPRDVWLAALALMGDRLHETVWRQIDSQAQRLDGITAHLGRPSARLAMHQSQLARHAQRLRYGTLSQMAGRRQAWQAQATEFPQTWTQSLQRSHERLDRAALRLQLLDPRLVLQRGYAWLTDENGLPITAAAATHPGQAVQATLADGTVDLTVTERRLL
jgi:exodeoxyribonuclease VII large subunit